jgi:hypothetical protein
MLDCNDHQEAGFNLQRSPERATRLGQETGSREVQPKRPAEKRPMKAKKKTGRSAVNNRRKTAARGKPFAKGQSGNPDGRPIGSTNKVPREVRESIIEAMNADSGAVEFFRSLRNSKAGEDRRTFAQICARMAPRVLEADIALHQDDIGMVIVETGIDILNPPARAATESDERYAVRLKGWRELRKIIYAENPHLSKPADLDDEPEKSPKTSKT